MRIVFVNRFYWPAEPATSQLLHDLAESLAVRGWTVSVIAGHSSPSLPQRETRAGVEILRIGGSMTASPGLFRRALGFAVFHAALVPALWRTLRRGDILVALTDPPLLGLTATLVARARGASVMHWIHDIYPEVVRAISSRLAAGVLGAIFRPWRDLAWRRAAACVTLGHDMAAVLAEAAVDAARVHIVPNWAPHGVEPPTPEAIRSRREELGLGGKFVVGYSGNLGRVHDLTGVLDAAERLCADARFAFIFSGRGAAFATLEKAARDRGLANVRFLPPQPRRDLAVALAIPDVHLVSVREGCERYVFPSKLYGALAVGRPAILLGAPTSEVARTVEERGVGKAFGSRDSAALAVYLQALAKAPDQQRSLAAAALAWHRQSGGRERAVARWEAILRAVAVAQEPDMAVDSQAMLPR